MQLQVSSCASHCQGVTQVQQAFQSNSTIQQIGGAGHVAGELASQSGSGATSQLTSTIMQIQLGCLSECFGTATSDPSTAALTQVLLSLLSAFLPPPGSSGVQPTPGVQQNVVEQVGWQVQDGGADSQLQSASQTNTTVQITAIIESWPAYLGSAPAVPQPPLPQAVDQTKQQTWQLQIGCLFYCVDPQQVQQAQQSTTTIQIVEGSPGSPSATTVAVVRQTIWQVQVGCLAWCWNSTQVQEANTQSTIAVLTVPPPPEGSGPAPEPGPGTPPAPGPGTPQAPGPGSGPPDPGSAPGGTNSPASASSTLPPRTPGASGPIAAGPTSKQTGRRAAFHVLPSPGRTGLAMLTGVSELPGGVSVFPGGVSALPAGLLALAVSTPPRLPALATESSSAPHDETVKESRTAAMAHPLSAPPRRVIHAAPFARHFTAVKPPAIAPGLNSGGEAVLTLMLAAAGILSLAAVAGRRSFRHGWR